MMEASRWPFKLYAYHTRQCDPKRCTSLKLHRFNFIKLTFKLRNIPQKAVILNPFSERTLSIEDLDKALNKGIVAIDCSWENIDILLKIKPKGTSRSLPYLIACNPTNFGTPFKLSTAEALAASLYILGFKEEAEKLLSIFKWGQTFLKINRRLLETYKKKTSLEIIQEQNKFMETSKTNSQRKP